MTHSRPKKISKSPDSKADHMRHRSMISRHIDPVSRNAIWKEHCLKENGKLTLSTHFHINPSTVAYIAEKPNRFKPSVKVTQEDIEETKKLLSGMWISNDNDLAPSGKNEVPQTSSQEYGWCSRPLVEPEPLLIFPRKSSAITQFATKYQECMQKSPYAKRDLLDLHFAKKDAKKAPDYAHTGVNTSRLGTPSATSSGQGSVILRAGETRGKHGKAKGDTPHGGALQVTHVPTS